ncbi:hypothetical protein BH09PSE3_BH09PSE3_11690 [soil metagenome]
MMNEPKPFASLSSTLLARKGHAKPAMRPQGFAGFGMAPAPSHDDLGWNDMGHEAHSVPAHVGKTEASPAPATADIVPILAESPPIDETVIVEAPAVVRQQEDLVRELTPLAAEAVRKIRAVPGSKGKAAFTLRLDPDRHLKLRLVSAVSHRSAQHIVVEALDAYLTSQSALAALATAKTPR